MVSKTWEETPLQGADERERFEQALLPHMDAAYNPHARCSLPATTTRRRSYLYKRPTCAPSSSPGGFRGANSLRLWLLTIVRNTCYTWLDQKRARGPETAFDEEIHSVESNAMDPEKRVLREEDEQSVRRAVEELPVELREVVVLRELEGMSYKEIAAIAGIPMGTVMSRLARARERLRERLA